MFIFAHQFFFLKKAYKIFLKCLLVFFVLVGVLWVMLQTTFFQNFIIHKVAKRLSKDLNTTVSIKHVDFALFNKMLLQGTLVLDHKKDTLLHAGELKVNITDWFFWKDNITLSYVGLDDAIINLNRKDSVWNYQFLVDYFSGPKSTTKDTSASIELNLDAVELNRVKIYQKDEWRGEDQLISVNKLSLKADKFDLNKNIINIRSITLDHPVFSQYEYDGNRPEDTTTPAPKVIKDITGGLRWNTDDWHIFIKNIDIKNGAFALEKQSDQPALTDRFDERHLVLSNLNGTVKNSVNVSKFFL